jgi:hypothetical protein
MLIFRTILFFQLPDNFNFSDFEAESDPFERAELQTLDDLGILARFFPKQLFSCWCNYLEFVHFCFFDILIVFGCELLRYFRQK